MLVLGSSSTYSPSFNIAAKIVSLYYFFEPQYFGPDLRLARTKTAIPIRSVQNADCRLQTGYKMQTRYILFFRLNVTTCHLTTYRASRNRFSAIIFHDLHYCGIFLARFLVTIVLNIISSLRVVFPLYARVGWCDVWTEFTNSTKVDVDVDVNEISLLNI